MADWFAISLRWVMLVGLVVSLGLGGRLELSTAWPLGLLIVWNLGMTALASLNIRMSRHRQVSIAVDLLLTGAFFWVQGGLRGPAFWAGFMPILTGSIYYEMLGGLFSAVFFSGLILYAGFQNRADLPLALTITAVMAFLGVLFGFMGRRLIVHMRRTRDVWLDTEERRRRIQNERLRAIYELTSTLAATLSYKRVLESALDMGTTALNPDP
jgi:hypothetical protein